MFDLVLKTELAAGPTPPFDEDDEDPREFLLRELARLRAAGEAEAGGEGGSQS